MKRLAVVLAMILVISGVVVAQGINLGTFPLGTWVDANYDAEWEFTTGNIRILSPAGEVYFDFGKATIQGLTVGVENGSPTLTFSCSATGKTYKLTKPLTNTALVLEIDPPWNVHYTVTMAKK